MDKKKKKKNNYSHTCSVIFNTKYSMVFRHVKTMPYVEE